MQSAHAQLRVSPYAVHATYSLDRHDGLAKAQRFREAGLWRVDPPSYFEGKFLAYNATPSAALPSSFSTGMKRTVMSSEGQKPAPSTTIVVPPSSGPQLGESWSTHVGQKAATFAAAHATRIAHAIARVDTRTPSSRRRPNES